MKVALCVIFNILLLAGCETSGPKQKTGAVVGAGLGGLLGAQANGDHKGRRNIAIIVGSLAGTAIGDSVGKSMDATDRMKGGQSLETGRTGESTSGAILIPALSTVFPLQKPIPVQQVFVATTR